MWALITFTTTVLFLIWWHLTKQKGPKIPLNIPSPPSLPVVGHALSITRKKALFQLESWAYQYGPIYQTNFFGAESVVISDMDTILTILRERPHTYRRIKTMTSMFQEFNLEGLFSLEGNEWKESRRITASALSSPRVAAMKTCIADHLLEMRVKLDELARNQTQQVTEWFQRQTSSPPGAELFRPAAVLDVHPIVQHIILSIVAETTLSFGQQTLIDPAFFSDINFLFENISRRMFTPVKDWCQKWLGKLGLPSDYPRIHRTTDGIKNVTRQVIRHWEETHKSKPTVSSNNKHQLSKEDEEAQLAQEKLERTFLHGMLEAKGSLSEDLIIGNVSQVMIAGFETTAGTLMWALYYLAKYPEIQRRLQLEADEVIGKPTSYDPLLEKELRKKQIENLALLDISDFPYTHNFIRELLRHRPVSAAIPVTTNQPVSLLGHDLPANTDIRLLTRMATLKATPTPDPFSFNPDRWDLDPQSEVYKRQVNCLLAFGSGPRVCPGRHLAMLELVLFVSCVYSRYHIKFFPLPTGHEEVQEVTAFTHKPENLRLWFQYRY